MDGRSSVRAAVCIAAAGLLAACAGYSQFYRPAPGATPEAIAAMRAAPPTGQPIVERAESLGDAASVLDAYAKRGYRLLGSSVFNTHQMQSDDNAIQQGKQVGADLVVIANPRYTGSSTTAVPITMPTSTTSYTTGTATAFGPGGTVNAFGNSTTTTYGSTTTMIPITQNRHDYAAVYFIKAKWGFGALWRDLNDAERQELQSNKGVFLRVVVDNSPAYLADILPGDIVLAVDGEPVLNQESLAGLLQTRAGRLVNVSLYRKGNRLDKQVQLAQGR